MADQLMGPEKAAVLLLAMGDQFATEVFRNLEPHEVQRLGAYMSKGQDWSLDQVEKVVEEFHRKAFRQDQGIIHRGEEYVKRLVLAALGEERARPILEKLSSSRQEVDLSFVRELDPRNLVNFIKLEHPQTIALIFSYMPPAKAAEALSYLSDSLKAEVVMRMAGLETVDTSMVEEIANVLEREVRISSGGTGSHKVSGLQTVAEVMNNMDKATTGEILSTLAEMDKELADGIQELMFVFDDLILVDDRGIQAILKNVENDTLILALRTASEEIKEKIFKNMSTRAAQMIQEEMEVMGPTRISEVEEAQKKIAAVARQLEESGEIVISKGEGDVVV